MATREEIVKRFSGLPGVGPKKAEHLYDGGYTTLEKLRSASKEELMEVEGVGPKLAEAIVKGLQELEAPEEEQKIEVVEREEKPSAPKAKERAKAKAEDVVEIVEEEAYRAKLKPDLPPEVREALRLRRVLDRHTPAFNRDQWFRYKKIDRDVWRKPSGISNKQLKQYRYRGRMPRAGYGGPALARGLHPSGFREVLVHNPAELSLLDPKTQAARIAGGVGARKRRELESLAAEKGVRVLNPRRQSR